MATKIGIIGAGGMVNYHIAGFVQAGAEIVAIADMNMAAAQRIADANGIPNVFSDVAGMLALDEIDAVSIIVPNKFHAPLSIQALEAGKHVFCEKPPALSAAEAQTMIDTAAKAGKRLMFNFNNRARPESYAMMGYVKDGTIGTINSAQAKWCRRTGIPGFGGWFTTKALSGSGFNDRPSAHAGSCDVLHGLPRTGARDGKNVRQFYHRQKFQGPVGTSRQ
ncbi:MAG: Gfo/Idh/MocA family oxidoreductase [Verrucomicrobiales bacterium]